MKSDILPFGEWLPDQESYNSEGASVATNVYTDGETYRPVQSLNEISDALGAQCYGAYSYLDPDGNVSTFAATRTKIYQLDGTSWADVTNTGGDYTTPIDGCWHFTQFGARVIATNYADKIQSFVVGTSTNFEDLISSGPDVRARNLGVVNNFLVGIDIFDSDGATQNRVRWAPINNPAGNWTPSQSTQSDYQNVEDGNPGQGVAVIGSQNYGILLFQNAIYRMEYVGPPAIFQFTLMEANRGAVNGQSVASDGRRTYYKAEDGFYMFDGVSSIPIGHKKVDRWFRSAHDTEYKYNIRATIDPINKNVLWAFTTTGSGNSRNDAALVYNWADNRFTKLDIQADVLFRSFTEGQTLDDIGSDYSDIEAVPYSFDSRYWVGGEMQLAGFGRDNKLAYFSGDNLTATMETQEVRLNPDGLAYVRSVTPVYSGGAARCRLGTRGLLSASVAYSAYVSPSPVTGDCNFNIESRYQRAGVEISGAWEQFKGIRIEGEDGSAV